MKACLGGVFIAGLSLLCGGCTLIGGVAGKLLVDNRNAHSRQIMWDSLHVVPKGRMVSVMLMSGDTIIARFKETDTLSSDSYRIIYDQVHTEPTMDSILPYLGDTITITGARGRSFTTCFEGFSLRSLVHCPSSAVSSLYLPLRSVKQMQHINGLAYDMNRIRMLMDSHRLPLNYRLVLDSPTGTVSLAPEDVSTACLQPRNTKYWLLLGGIGLVIDAVITIIIIESWQHTSIDLGQR